MLRRVQERRPSQFRGTPDCNESAVLHSYGLDAHCRSVLCVPTTGCQLGDGASATITGGDVQGSGIFGGERILTDVDFEGCKKAGGRWKAGEKSSFGDYTWKEAVPGADGTVEKPFGDWYYSVDTRTTRRTGNFGKPSLALGPRPYCGEKVHTSTMKDGKVDPDHSFPTQPTRCSGANGASPSIANRVSFPGGNGDHRLDWYQAFREGKHYVEGLPWSVSVDETGRPGYKPGLPPGVDPASPIVAPFDAPGAP